MLHDIAGVGDDAGHHHLALGQLHVLEHVIFVLVAAVRALEGVITRVDLQDMPDHLMEGGLMDARPLIDAVAGVEAHLLGGNAANGVVDDLHIKIRLALQRGLIVLQIDEEVGHEGIVDLHEKARLHDGEIFRAHGLAHRMEIVFLGLVIFIVGNGAGGGRGHECGLRARGVHGGAHIREIPMQRRLPAVVHRPHAENWDHRRDRAAQHGPREIARVIFGEGRDLLREHLVFDIGPLFEPFQPLVCVGEEALFGHFAIGHDVDAHIDLLADDLRHRLLQPRLIGGLIDGAAFEPVFHQIEEIDGSRQRSNMGRQNSVSAGHAASLPHLFLCLKASDHRVRL